MTNARRHALVFLAALFAVPLGAQERPTAPYVSTMTFGTGLVSIPVAWISPTSGDIFASFAARTLSVGPLQGGGGSTYKQLSETIEAHFWGRLSVGVSVYSLNQSPLFARVLLLRQGTSGLPSIAVGVRNVGASAYVDRFVAGDRHVLDVVPDSVRTPSLGRINGSPTIYAVMTREFQFARNTASLSVGYGNGLFSNNGGLDTIYNRSGTLAKGLFLGGRMVFPVSTNGAVTFMFENDAWDWNIGAMYRLGHVSAGLYVTELEGTKGVPKGRPLANFLKNGLMLAYSANLPDIISRSGQRAEAAEAELRAKRLRQEIAARSTQIRKLQVQLARAGEGAAKINVAVAARLAKELEVQRQAMQAASDQLQKLQARPNPDDRR